MVGTDDPVAFLRCKRCLIEHTTGLHLGVSRTASHFYWRFPNGEWIRADGRRLGGQKRPPCQQDRRPLATIRLRPLSTIGVGL